MLVYAIVDTIVISFTYILSHNLSVLQNFDVKLLTVVLTKYIFIRNLRIHCSYCKIYCYIMLRIDYYFKPALYLYKV